MKIILFTSLRKISIERIAPIEAARALGYQIALMTSNLADPANEVVDFLIEVKDPYNHNDCLNQILAFHKRHPIDGVLCWTDRDVELIAALGKRLNLKTLSVQAAKNVRNKFYLREALNQYPELSPQYYLVTNFSEFKNAIHRINKMAIFKPCGASGSTAIYKLSPEDDLESLYKRMQEATDVTRFPMCSFYDGQYICEEYIEGDEVSVDGLICDNNIYIAGVTDKDVTENFSLEYNGFFPSSKPTSIIQEIKSKAKTALNLLKLNNCAFHLEGRYNNTDGFKILECAGRAGGGLITSHLIPLATGHSLHKNIIQMAMGEKIDWRIDDSCIKQYAGEWDQPVQKAGVVKNIKGFEEAKKVDGIQEVIPFLAPGDQTLVPPESFSCAEALLIATGETPEKVKNTLDIARMKYEIIID